MSDSHTPRLERVVTFSCKRGHLGGHEGDTVDDFTGQEAQTGTFPGKLRHLVTLIRDQRGLTDHLSNSFFFFFR